MVTSAITPTATVSLKPSFLNMRLRYLRVAAAATRLPGCCAGQDLSVWQLVQVGFARKVLSSWQPTQSVPACWSSSASPVLAWSNFACHPLWQLSQSAATRAYAPAAVWHRLQASGAWLSLIHISEP